MDTFLRQKKYTLAILTLPIFRHHNIKKVKSGR